MRIRGDEMDTALYLVLFALVGRLMHKKGDVLTWDGLLVPALVAAALYVVALLLLRDAVYNSHGIWAI